MEPRVGQRLPAGLQGKLRAIGVSNFGIAHLDKLMKTARVKPAVNQVELSPFLQRRELVSYCRQHGIALEVSLCSSLLPLVHAWHRQSFRNRAVCKLCHSPTQNLGAQHDLHGGFRFNPGRLKLHVVHAASVPMLQLFSQSLAFKSQKSALAPPPHGLLRLI